jgi:hypothetical protein
VVGFRISESGLRYSRWLDRYALRRGNAPTPRRVPVILGGLLRTAPLPM